MDYTLNKKITVGNEGAWKALKKFAPLLSGERTRLIISLTAILVNSSANLIAPALIGYTIDAYITTKNINGVIIFSLILLSLYLIAYIANYIQIRVMGQVGQHILFKLRNNIFSKLQELPIAFFNQNKAGDLISRINNDTEKLNQFFSQAIIQFIGIVFMIFGASIFVIVLHPTLGLASLVPAIFLLVLTRLLSAWIRRRNAMSLKSTGALSGEIQESLSNFRVIVAFNRQDYFRSKFKEANEVNFKASIKAGLANNSFTPLYSAASNIAQLIVLVYGIHLILAGSLTVGLLVSFVLYIARLYDPIRQLAAVWSLFQLALASWDRISEILSLTSTLTLLPKTTDIENENLLSFKQVSFKYPASEKEILHDISLSLCKGKTYALVGPTGGGKTTTASLMARLFDPTEGIILFNGKDIRTWSREEISGKIGFILQDPFLFTGTVRENILYGNTVQKEHTSEDFDKLLAAQGLESLLSVFPNGLDTEVTGTADSISLGQKQIIAFIRAILRKPALLILDEATANIDTVTEQILEQIIAKLPKETTKVIIAHRLNTIEAADEIFFIGGGTITQAGSFDDAVAMLLHKKSTS